MHRIMEYSELEGTHEDHQSPAVGPAQNSPRNHTNSPQINKQKICANITCPDPAPVGLLGLGRLGCSQ